MTWPHRTKSACLARPSQQRLGHVAGRPSRSSLKLGARDADANSCMKMAAAAGLAVYPSLQSHHPLPLPVPNTALGALAGGKVIVVHSKAEWDDLMKANAGKPVSPCNKDLQLSHAFAAPVSTACCCR